MQIIDSTRLYLQALSRRQLELCLCNPSELERELGFPITSDLVDENVTRALKMKTEKMERADPFKHEWFTYWLVVIRNENIGAGLVGFKGEPDTAGSVEIGYGMSPTFQGRGLMSEAVRVLADWALNQAECQCVTATRVTNPASRNLLEKLGGAAGGRESKRKLMEDRASLTNG